MSSIFNRTLPLSTIIIITLLVFSTYAAAENVCGNITAFCQDNGYNGRTNNTYAYRDDVLYYAYWDERDYGGTMVFHVGHRATSGYQDNTGYDENAIIPSDVLSHTDLGKHFFVFLWVCEQAPDKDESPSSGSMAAAWLQRDGSPGRPLLDDDGFGSNSDNKDQCYISFYGFSPMLSSWANVSGPNGTFYENSPNGDFPCEWFIIKFYYYALCEGYSVCDSLDIASEEYFGLDYSNSPLNKGYNSWWPGGEEWESTNMSWLNASGYFPMDYTQYVGDRSNNTMRVFGDSSIKLYPPLLTVNATDSGSNPVSADVYIDDDYAGTAGNSFRVLRGWHTVRVESTTNIFHNFPEWQNPEFQNYIYISVWSDKTLLANFYADPPPQYELSISAGEGGTTLNPYSPGEHILTPQLVTVTADPDSGYFFDYWLLDDVPHYVPCYEEEPSITVPMSSNHTLQACFTPEPSYYWVSSIYGYDGLVDHPEKLVGWRSDGEFTYLTGLGPTEYYGWINATMNAEAAAHIYLYGYADYEEGPVYVYVSSDGEEWDFVSAPEVTQSSPYWIDCGLCDSPFNYILLTTENPETVYTIALDSVRVEPFAYYNLTVSSGAGGYTVPATGVHEYPETSQVPVTAYANGGYDFDYWLLDGDPYTQNPITVTMNSDHELQAFFCEEPVYHWLTVDAYDEYEYELNPDVWVDGDWAGSAPVMVSVTEGWHTVEVEDPWLYWQLVWFSDGYDNGESRPVYSDTTITAYYEFYY